MKFLILTLNFFFWSFCQAQVLLVPTKEVPFEKYQQECKKTGYICTTDYLLEKIQNQETPLFDSLINDLDYSSEKFCSEISPRVLRVLKEENISLEQVEVLQKLLEQTKEMSSPSKQKQIQAIEAQLKENLLLVQNETVIDLPESFLVVFKKPISAKAEKKLKSNLFKIKSNKIEFNHSFQDQKDLVTGICDNEFLHDSIQAIKWQVTREKSCHFSEQFGQISTQASNFISENKTSLLVAGVVVLGTAILLNNYQIQLSF